MTTQKTKKKHSPRAMRFAEAGVLFVLLLAVVVAVGVKMNGGDEPVVVAEERPDTAELAETVLAMQATEHEAATEIIVTEDAVIEEPEHPAVETVRDRYADAAASVVYEDGEAAYFAREYDEAADLFELYAERRPENAWGHYMLGLSLWKADALGDAEDALVRSLELDPDHVKSLVNLARVRLASNLAEQALAPVEQALAVDPDYSDGYRVLGRVLHTLERRDEATDAYHEALARRADDPWSLNNLGLILIEQDACDAALAPLARAAELAPDVAVIANNLGIALERTGRTAQAAEIYLTAADAGHAKAVVSLARVETLIADGGDAGDTLDLAVVAASFTALPRYAAGSAGNDEAVAHAPDATASADADSAAVAVEEPESSTVALGGGGGGEI